MTESDRRAVYTASDEICLQYQDPLGGSVHLYYSPSQYAKRQTLFGPDLYPNPTPEPAHEPA